MESFSQKSQAQKGGLTVEKQKPKRKRYRPEGFKMIDIVRITVTKQTKEEWKGERWHTKFQIQ